MSLKQFMWNLAGRESELPEDDLVSASDQVSVPPDTHRSGTPGDPINNGPTGSAPQPLSPGSLADYVRLYAGAAIAKTESSPTVSSEELQSSPVVETRASQNPTLSLDASSDQPVSGSANSVEALPPTTPTSFFGSWFGSSPTTPVMLSPTAPTAPTVPTVVEEEATPDAPGFGAFFAHLVGGDETPLESERSPPESTEAPVPDVPALKIQRKGSRLEELADTLISPTSNLQPTRLSDSSAPVAAVAVAPAPSQPAKFEKFDTADAEDVVDSLESGQPRRPPRLLVGDANDAKLRFEEGLVALRKLKSVQGQTDGRMSQTFLKKTTVEKENLKTVPEDRSPVSQEWLMKLKEDSKRALVEAKRALREAKEDESKNRPGILLTRKICSTTHSTGKRSEKPSPVGGTATAVPRVGSYRAHHYIVSSAPSSSDRLKTFAVPERYSHTNQPIPNNLLSKGALVVASVESRVVPRNGRFSA